MAFEGIGLGGGMSLTGGISIGTLVGHVVADISKWTGGLDKAAGHLKLFSLRMDKFLQKNAVAMRRIGMRAAIVGGAVVAGVGAMVKSYGDFERRMRRAAAVSEYTEKQFEEMSAMAERMSVELNIAARQAADGFYFLGSAGLIVQEQMAAFPGVLKFAKAGVMEVGHAAEITVDIVKGMGATFDEVTEMTDILTAAFTSANLTLSHLGESTSLVASIAKDSHTPLNQVAAAFGLMANAGIKGSRAGTALRRAFVNLMDPSKEMRQEMNNWGLEVYDATGKMKPFVDIVIELSKAFEGAGEEQRKHAMATIFGVRAITGMQAIFALGTEGLKDYAEAIKDAGGATQDVVDKQMKAFLEQVGRVTQRIKLLARHLGRTLAPAVRSFADWVGPLIDDMVKWVDTHEVLTTAIVATTTAMGVMLLVSGTLTLGLAGLAIAAGALGVSVIGLGVAVTAVTLGVGALVGAFTYLVIEMIKTKKQMRELKRELDLKEEIKSLRDFTTMINEAFVVGPGPLADLLDKLLLLKKRLEDVRLAMGKAMVATKAELTKILKDAGYEIERGVLGIPPTTTALRIQVLSILKKAKERMLTEVDEATAAAQEMMDKRTDVIKAGVQKEITIFQEAWRLRQRARSEEYEDWLRTTHNIAAAWTELDFVMVETTREAIDDMQDAMVTFFTDTLMEAKSWKDHFISFLREIQRAMVRTFATQLAEQIMGTAVVSSIMGGLFKGVRKTPASPNLAALAEKSQAWLSEVPAMQAGGIVTRPTLAMLGERGREAVIPLSGAQPAIEVNVINQTSRPVTAERGATRIDGGKLVTNVILKDIEGYGPIRGAITNLRG